MKFWKAKKKAAKTNNEKGVYQFKNNAMQVKCSVWFERLDPIVKRIFNEIVYDAHKEFYYSTVLELQEIVFKLQDEKNNAFETHGLEYDIIIDFIVDGKFPDAYALPGEVVFRRGHKTIDCGNFYVDLSSVAKISTYGLDTHDYQLAVMLNEKLDSGDIKIDLAVDFMKENCNGRGKIPSGIAKIYPNELFSDGVTSMSNLDGDLSGRVYYNGKNKFDIEANKVHIVKDINEDNNGSELENELKKAKKVVSAHYGINIYDLYMIGFFVENDMYNITLYRVNAKDENRSTYDVKILGMLATIKEYKNGSEITDEKARASEWEFIEKEQNKLEEKKEYKDMTITNDEFINKAKAYINAKMGVDKSKIFVVWSSKTLQNHKALLSFHGQHELGDYIEANYNGDKKETYYDIYKKQSNEAIKDDGELSQSYSEDEVAKLVLSVKDKLLVEIDDLSAKMKKLSSFIEKGRADGVTDMMQLDRYSEEERTERYNQFIAVSDSLKATTTNPNQYFRVMERQLEQMGGYRASLQRRIDLMNK